MAPKPHGKGIADELDELVQRNLAEQSFDPLAAIDIGDIDLDSLMDNESDMNIDGVAETNEEEADADDETQPPSQHEEGTGVLLCIFL